MAHQVKEQWQTQFEDNQISPCLYRASLLRTKIRGTHWINCFIKSVSYWEDSNVDPEGSGVKEYHRMTYERHTTVEWRVFKKEFLLFLFPGSHCLLKAWLNLPTRLV